MTQQEVWDLVVQNERLLRREVARYLPRSRLRELDELYSDVVYGRAQAIMQNFDPGRGVKPATFLVSNCRWYAFEWAMGRKYKKVPPPVDLTESRHAAPRTGQDLQELVDVQHVVEQLPEEYRQVLEWYFLKGYDVPEISRHLGLRRAETRARIDAALFMARMELCEPCTAT